MYHSTYTMAFSGIVVNPSLGPHHQLRAPGCTAHSGKSIEIAHPSFSSRFQRVSFGHWSVLQWVCGFDFRFRDLSVLDAGVKLFDLSPQLGDLFLGDLVVADD